jgi:energy-coupling factor transporter ATP-binding protein EcfA2
MNEPFRPARTLPEVALQATLEPLPLGDPRYVDLSRGQGSRELRQYLEDHAVLSDPTGTSEAFATAIFTGHRGCGKSTVLLRLARDLDQHFTTMHLYADDSLVQDLDYPDLFLWLLDRLLAKLAEEDVRCRSAWSTTRPTGSPRRSARTSRCSRRRWRRNPKSRARRRSGCSAPISRSWRGSSR